MCIRDSNYSDYFAQHPVFELYLLSFISFAAMGLLDSVVFSLREKPWQHIPGSDGTFWGSFLFWKHANQRRGSSVSIFSSTAPIDPIEKPQPTRPSLRPSLRLPLGSIKEVLSSKETVTRRKLEEHQQRAQAASLNHPRRSVTLEPGSLGNAEPQASKEWFDRRLSFAAGRDRRRSKDIDPDSAASST